MNKKIIGVLATLAALNTACSKEENMPPSYTNTSTAASVATVSSAATAAEVIESTMAEQEDEVAATQENTSPPASEFLNTYWKLTVLKDVEITVGEKEREPHIIFNADNRISGSDGCNSIMGNYKLEGEKLTLSQIASTMIACAEGGEHAHEFKKSLEEIATFSVHADQLELRNEKGLVLARFKAVALP